MAINMMGRCYEKGWGVAPDRVQATRFYRAAAEGGLDWGMYNYGSALGLGAGVRKDERAALDWFRKAAAQGHAKSINFVGHFLEDGKILPRDRVRAADCYRRAAEGGDFRGQFNLARLLAEDGRVDEAVAWMCSAARNANENFRVTMRDWLATTPHPTLRAMADSL